jgi:hypothetical protein
MKCRIKQKSGATLSGRAALNDAFCPPFRRFCLCLLLAGPRRMALKPCGQRTALLEFRHNLAKIGKDLRRHD